MASSPGLDAFSHTVFHLNDASCLGVCTRNGAAELCFHFSWKTRIRAGLLNKCLVKQTFFFTFHEYHQIEHSASGEHYSAHVIRINIKTTECSSAALQLCISSGRDRTWLCFSAVFFHCCCCHTVTFLHLISKYYLISVFGNNRCCIF